MTPSDRPAWSVALQAEFGYGHEGHDLEGLRPASGFHARGAQRHSGNGEAAHEDWTALAVAFVASAVTAFVAVKWLLNYIKGHRFTVFAIYRFILGIALLLLVPAGS